MLREQLSFRGVIFSDDLTMEGASVVGGDVARALAALNASCDMVLLCNDQTRCSALLAGLVAQGVSPNATQSNHLKRMHAKRAVSLSDPAYVQAKAVVDAAVEALVA